MKNFYKSFNTILLILTLLTFGATSAWGLDQYVTVTDFNSSTTYSGSNLNHVSGGTFSKTDNHVTFSINGLDGYQDSRLMYAGIGSYPGSRSSTLSWGVEDANYTLLVTGVSVSVRGYQATTSPQNVSATISGGGQTSTTANCQTNNTSGASGAKSASISNASGISSATLSVNTTSSKPKFMGFTVDTHFGITSVTYTYKVTHKEYLFGFAAVANKNISAAGNVSASVKNETVQAGVGETSASTTATFTASANDGYRFVGWYDNSSYTGSAVSTATTYKPTINNNTAGSVQTLTLYAKFVPVTVNSVNPSTTSVTFTKPETKSITLTFNVSNADAKADFNTPTISNTTDWSLTSWSYANNQLTVVVSMTVTGNVTAKGSHNTTVTLTSKGSSDNQSQMATINATVDMNPVYTCNIANSYYVDDAALNLNALWTSTSDGAKTYTVTSFTPSGINNVGATTPYITGSSLYLSQAGTVQLKLSQAASTSYNSGEDTKTLVISKRDNTISISGFDDEPQHKIAIESYDNELVLTSNNTDYTNWPIQNEQITGDYTMASFGRQDGTQDKWVVYTDRTPGLVEWRLWQEETYKYKGAETTFSVNVVKNTNCSCNLVEMSWTDDLLHNPPTVSTVGPNEDGLIDFGDIGEYLYFSLRKNGVNGDDMNYSLFTDGAWGGNVHKWAESMTSYTPFVIDMSDKDHHTTKVQFYKGHTSEYWIGGDTDDPFINNISVTRKRWMKYLAKETDKSQIASLPYLPKQERVLGDAATSYTFYVDFSTCSEWVKVASLDDHVTFDNDMTKKVVSTDPTANNTRGYDGIVPLTIKYYSENVEKKDVKIIFYTEFDNDTLIVPVETVGYIFKGTTDTVWTKGENWNVGKVPNEIHDVIIESPAVIATEVIVNSITITTGSVTILPTGGLTVGKGGITGANTTNLYLRAGKTDEVKGQTGYLRVDPATALDMPAATVELFSKAYYDYNDKTDNIARWQYVGSPLASTDVKASSVYKLSWIYSWDESSETWFNERATLEFTPFVGYSTTQRFYANGILLEYKGQIVSNKGKHDIDLAWSGKDKGYNALANSFTAPIDITNFEDGDFYHADSTVYLFNTGSRSEAIKAASTKSTEVNNPGQFLSIPIGSARLLKKAYDEMPTTISPMQGFFVHALAGDARVTIDYNKLVWNGNYAKNKAEPLRAPKHTNNAEDEEVGSLQISLFSNTGADHLFMLEAEQFDAIFENGYDARKLMGDELNIFSIKDDYKLAVDATNSLIGTQIGVRTGDTTAYVLVFTHLNSERPLALLDNEISQQIDINEGTEYKFFAVPNSEVTDRFSIVESANAPTVTTGIEETNSGVKAQKFIKNGQLFILKNGVLYTATGTVVR